ncbi:SRPBCC family protein [Streptomyces sp. NPDC005244]|uniref:SRPBCC family protein n=1 Tax=Streptomyces sp. NPDC005244 TaxID=3364708 RepID=UPI0036A44DB4
MSGQFEATTEVNRPIEEVFAFLAAGTNDPKFSPRVQEITKTPEGPTAVGTIFTSTVKDAGMKSARRFRITEFEAPHLIRWTEISKNSVTADQGGYDLESTGAGTTRVRIFNVLNGHGIGKLLVGFALGAARKDAPAFGQRIKTAVEAS